MPGFVIDPDWYWRIFEGDACFVEAPGATAAHDFLRPLAWIAKDQVAIDHIEVDPDGNGVHFQIGELAVAIRCQDLRLDRFVELLNAGFAAAQLDLAFAIVESRRYELRGVLLPRDAARNRRFARGTLPP